MFFFLLLHVAVAGGKNNVSNIRKPVNVAVFPFLSIENVSTVSMASDMFELLMRKLESRHHIRLIDREKIREILKTLRVLFDKAMAVAYNSTVGFPDFRVFRVCVEIARGG